MSFISYFPRAIETPLPPCDFPSPFSNASHPLAHLASELLQERLKIQKEFSHDFDVLEGGKMFGVLVVKDENDRLGFLSAFSGMLSGKWFIDDFVPPVFDEGEIEKFLPDGENHVARLSNEIETLLNSARYQSLIDVLREVKEQKIAASIHLKKQLFENKMRRKIKRDALTLDDSADTNKMLIKLSFESQQDKKDIKAFNQLWAGKIQAEEMCVAEFELKVNEVKQKRAKLSRTLQQQLFSKYQLHNVLGETSPMASFFDKNNPPGGAGDCAAPKLLQFAIKNKIHPIAMAEFWWGAPPKEGVRHHQHYYPSCRGKCRPILPFMLKGLNVQPAPKYGNDFSDRTAPETLYEDDNLLVVNKPEGLLSVPGKEVDDSVFTRIQQRYPKATGPLLVHRLDMDTSGVLLIAKNEMAHKFLQQQFISRRVKKSYVAILACPIKCDESQNEGVVKLPLRVDLDDRPRQLVCYTHGKSALTHWKLISQNNEEPRLYFYPHTGRTHQLRLHAAHVDGLNAPIKGDKLYGNSADRLYLHAEHLTFITPSNNQEITISAPVPF